MSHAIREIVLTIDQTTVSDYTAYYFQLHPKAKKPPIQRPYHESINAWMILRRPMMNALKQRWKDFIEWLVNEQGYANLRIAKCEIRQRIYYPNNRRHDTDNSVPKFILDGLVNGGMIVDDDFRNITRLCLECDVDRTHPRTELYISVFEYKPESKEESTNGEQE